MAKMRVLITGGAGYLGSTLAPWLLHKRYAVTVLDNFMYPGSELALANCCCSGDFSIVNGDARNLAVVEPLIQTHDVIIPLAAIVGHRACNADIHAAWSTNLYIISTMCQRSLSPQQRMIIPVTNSGYGIGGAAECTEDSPLRPLSGYGRQKVDAEKVAMSRENCVSLRLATVFGMSPRMRTDLLVNDFVLRAVRDGFIGMYEPHFRRNFIHVRDVAFVFEHVINNWDRMKSQIYNVGDTAANMSKMQLAEKIKVHHPKLVIHEMPGADIDKRDYVVSNAKLEATGWSPVVSIDRGIIELTKGYRAFRPVHANA
jgi:nucleoside-diphosphate-sugar epimerase